MTTATGTVRYATTVISVGPMVQEFLAQGMLILFGENAPEELHDFCVLHRPDVAVGGIRSGDQLVVDGTPMSILAVGDVADENLKALGHVSLKTNGETTAPLPGDVCLEKVALHVHTGSRLEIVSQDEPRDGVRG